MTTYDCYLISGFLSYEGYARIDPVWSKVLRYPWLQSVRLLTLQRQAEGSLISRSLLGIGTCWVSVIGTASWSFETVDLKLCVTGGKHHSLFTERAHRIGPDDIYGSGQGKKNQYINFFPSFFIT